jgi:thiamine pyrophosphokinase
VTTPRPGGRGRSSDTPPGVHAVVVGDGEVPARAELDAAWPGWSDGASLVIAADGGLARAQDAGLDPSLLVGDLDSLDPGRLASAERAGLTIVRASPDKDESDTELAVLEAVRRGATRITVLGAFGGERLDHELANVWLLAHPALGRRAATLLDAAVRVRMLAASGDGDPGPLALPGRLGATVSLLPLGGDAVGVTTRGLRFPLDDEDLTVGPARGLSNVRVARDAAVTLRGGKLLVVEAAFAPAGLSSAP